MFSYINKNILCNISVSMAPSMDSNPAVLMRFKNFYCQPQKRLREICCLHAGINLVTCVGVIYVYTVHKEYYESSHYSSNMFKDPFCRVLT